MEQDIIHAGAAGGGEVQPAPGRVRGLRRAFVLAAITALTVGGSAALAASPTPTAGGASGPPASAPDPAKLDAALKAYAACMRSHGVDMPDPVSLTSSADAAATTVTGSEVIAIAVGGPGSLTAPVAGTAAGGAPTLVTSGSGLVPVPVDPKFEAADKACASILSGAGIPAAGSAGTLTTLQGSVSTIGLPAGSTTAAGIVSVGASAADTARLVDQMKSYASCMRTQGVDVPDPTVDVASGAVQLSTIADPTSDAFRTADAACATGGFSMAPPAGALPAILAAPAATPGK